MGLKTEELDRLRRIKFREENFDVKVEASDEFDKWPFSESITLSVTFDGNNWHVWHMSYDESLVIIAALNRFNTMMKRIGTL